MTRARADESRPLKQFATFPEFSRLTLDDKQAYEKRVEGLPPHSDLSFPTLMLWWNFLDSCSISELNGNLVISYWLPGVESLSGLSLVGDTNIEQSMCEIFDWQLAKGDKPHLTHVPESVVHHIQHPELFTCESERASDEYIYDVSSFYPLSGQQEFRAKRIRAFEDSVGRENIRVTSLDMSNSSNIRLLRSRVRHWETTGQSGENFTMEIEAIQKGIQFHDELGLRNMCVFVDDELQGFCLYYISHDSKYAIVTNARMNPSMPWTIDYSTYAFGKMMKSQGIKFINMESDLGSEFMRTFKLSLGPTNSGNILSSRRLS